MYSREDLKRVYFQYQTEAVTRGQRWQLHIIASSVQLRCRDGLHGITLESFLLTSLTVAEIFSVCDLIKSDWQYANIFDK